MSAADPAILGKALDWLDDGRSVALATVIQTWGSAPQPVGSLLLIDAEVQRQCTGLQLIARIETGLEQDDVSGFR